MPAMTPEEAQAAAKAALKEDKPERAEMLARALLASGGRKLQTWMTLATAMRRQGRPAEALPILTKLCELVPQNYELHFDFAELCLLLGDFDRGWKEYRFRYDLPHTSHLRRALQGPAWDGQPIPGKTLLICDEQGYGDTFQFLRLIERAKAASGAHIVLQINSDQNRFAERMHVADNVILRSDLPPHFDMYCQLMDLPLALGLKLSDLPGTVPYLTVDAERLDAWRERLADLPRPLVALGWAGRSEHFNDARRSVPLSTLAPLGQSGATFLSIQKGARAEQAGTPPEGMKLIDLSGEIADFDDTAAILSLADLLVSVDTSPVHLAGALNRPAWVLLPLMPDWRWLTERTDSPWYPSVKLYRQHRRGDWREVVARAAEDLKGFCEGYPRR